MTKTGQFFRAAQPAIFDKPQREGQSGVRRPKGKRILAPAPADLPRLDTNCPHWEHFPICGGSRWTNWPPFTWHLGGRGEACPSWKQILCTVCMYSSRCWCRHPSSIAPALHDRRVARGHCLFIYVTAYHVHGLCRPDW